MNDIFKRRCFTALTFVVILAGAYFLTTSEAIVGRRCAKSAVYYWNPKYWPAYVSVFLWFAAVASTVFAFLPQTTFYEPIARYFHKVVRPAKRLSAKKSGRVGIAAFGAALLGVGLVCYFDLLKPIWRFLRYKIYGDYFQDPVETLLESGQFSGKLCVGPVIGIGVVSILYLCQKLNKRNLILLLIVLLGSSNAANADDLCPSGTSRKAITLISPAEYKITDDIQKITSTPSSKALDGGYNAVDSVLQCFAVASYRYTGGRYENENVLFRMRFPPRIERGKKYPLLIWLHGYAESVGDNKRHLAHLHHAFRSFYGPKALDFYAIALQCPPDNQNWQESISFKEGKGDSPLEILSEIVDAALAEFPIDDQRISVIGISTGANAAWSFVKRRSGNISGLVSFSGAPSKDLIPNDFKKTSIWAFNNKGDVNASWKRTSEFIDEVNALGGDGYITLQDHGLHDSWTEPLQKQNVVQWCISQSLNGEGLVQNVDVPRRSGTKVVLMFYLPGAIVFLSIFFGIARPRKDNN